MGGAFSSDVCGGGTCTVLVEGISVRACLIFPIQANGRNIELVEGLAQGCELIELQRALAEDDGLHAGIARRAY